MGKVAISSDMSPEEIRWEICSVFSDRVKLDRDEFPFSYLKSSGGGTKSLCISTISSKFKWNAQQVAMYCGVLNGPWSRQLESLQGIFEDWT